MTINGSNHWRFSVYGFLQGSPGGSVADALLQLSKFAVRAVTWDTSKPAAAKLKKAGEKVLSTDPGNKNNLPVALTGNSGAFVVTNFWEHFSKEKEVAQGKVIADQCKRLGLRHVIYSGLEDVKKMMGGKLEVLHFDGKVKVEEYFRAIYCPMTSVSHSFCFENLLTNYKPQNSKDGKIYELGKTSGKFIVRVRYVIPAVWIPAVRRPTP
ncbi:nmrA-like family domain-containing protein 1 [Pseudophryne corroboree]|uniref:nmrA-like family domain-containing protein 1 n=1 Tax=Pseudophryne corroboree TaxID=495146 RepID=UPI003081F848